MPAYIGQTATPRVDSKLIARAISANKVFPGQFACLNKLSEGISDNISVFESDLPTADGIKEQTTAVVVNDGFETLLDGRRPAGEPNYFHYEIPDGECFTCVFIDNHVIYHIGMEAIDEADRDDAEIGKYLIPQTGANFWAVADEMPENVACALKILAFRNLSVGGAEHMDSAPVAVCVGCVDKKNGGTDFLSFSLTDQVGDAVIDRVQDTISLYLAGDITSQVANFELSAGATAYVKGVAQQSGVTENDFSVPVDYDVSAGNGDTSDWVVVVTYAPYSVLAITSDAHCTISVKDEEGNPISVGINNIHYNQALTVDVSFDEGYGLDSLTLNGTEIANNSTIEVKGNVSLEATSQAL